MLTNVADSVASVSRVLARTRFQKVSVALFRYFPAKRGVTTIHDFDGDLSISLDRSSYISSAIYWRGHHSLAITRFLEDFLEPEMTLVDVGANIGEITLFAAKRLRRGRVLAFEPLPQTFGQLAHNVALNKCTRVRLFNHGLYDRQDSLPIYSKKDQPYGTTNHGVPSLFSTGTDQLLCSIPLRRFDDIAREESLSRLDLMKIDVEGAELMVLRGAEGSFERFRPVLIAEISETNFLRAGYSSAEFFRYMHLLNYDFRLLGDQSVTHDIEGDAVFFPRERQKRPRVSAE